jgi:hypothetical protein
MADSITSTSQNRDSKALAAPRFWYGGTTMPETAALEELESADPNPRCAYDQEAGRQLGPWANMMTRLRSQLLGLQPQAAMRAAPNPEKRLYQLLIALARFCETPVDRLAVLKHTGSFHFRRGESAQARKTKLQAVVADPADEADEVACTQQVRRLMEIWSPRPDSLLDSIINRPVEVGRTMAKRLDPGHQTRLSIFTRAIEKADHSVQYPLLESRSVAYEREGAIHLLGGLHEYMDEWQADGGEEEGRAKKGFTIFETLILHEVVEVILEETSPDLDRLSAHVIASTFERSIHGNAVTQAVEEFCVQWAETLQPAVAPVGEVELQAELDAQILTRSGDDAAAGEEGDEIPTWTEYLVTHEELRPEAYEMRTNAEQREILREMFGEDVAIEEDLAA